MTKALLNKEVAAKLAQTLPDIKVTPEEYGLVVKPDALLKLATHLKSDPSFDFDYLMCLSAVDYLDYFEVVYHLLSFNHNHSLILKTRIEGRANPEVPSVTPLWQGADLQEREAYDLMGIRFSGHPNLKRLFLYEGFQGHPQRKDYL
jgi:NADH-quinone oxidoreductase subunit C